MVLTDHEIALLCEGIIPCCVIGFYGNIGMGKVQKLLQRQCLKPLVTPFDPAMVNPHSLDIRIGLAAKLRTTHGYLDVDLSRTTKENPYLIYPGDRLLVESLEVFNIPEFVATTFFMKSSRGREWYGHQLAGYIDAGWFNSRLTMEITNDDIDCLPLYQGMRFGQLEFRLLLSLPSKSYKETGRYNNDLSVMESKG